MTRRLALILVSTAGLSMTAAPAFAESMFERMARQAAEAALQKAARAAAEKVPGAGALGGLGGGSSGASSPAARPAPEAASPAVMTPKPRRSTAPAPSNGADPAAAPAVARAGPAPWPTNLDAAPKYPGDLAFPAEIERQKDNFREFSKVRCTSCEGGWAYDSMIFETWDRPMSEWPVGERRTWKGSAADGEVSVASEVAVGPFPCKQLRYRLTRRADGATAEKPGLMCFGYTGPYAASQRWHEVL